MALKAVQAALADCHSKGFAVGSAVADSAGVIIVGMQATGTHPGTIYNAMRKTLVALEFGVRNSVVRDKLRAGDYATLARVRPSMTLFPGAVPLFSAGKLIGAIGVSGGPAGEIDEGCAAAGAAAIKDQLG
ncbi:MAG TPA: heme-binding protein [Caulobacteraceae bacterium]|nr:heme-binding protein [Caulobacteraceae bacterium]